jgi:hypothetical protein
MLSIPIGLASRFSRTNKVHVSFDVSCGTNISAEIPENYATRRYEIQFSGIGVDGAWLQPVALK